jgi:eukaryotic-like serine/threonine-protein kinase
VVALVAARSLLASSTADLNTPNVIHLTLSDAESTLADQGLKVGTIVRKYTGKPNANIVIDQNPPAGIFLRKGQAVDLVVSRGVREVPVPAGLVGQTVNEATAALEAAGLKLGSLVPKNSSAPANQVLGSRPPAGTSLPAGSKVVLVVSNSRVKVPDVVGKDSSTATAIMLEAGFNPILRRSAVFTPGAIDTVVSQSPTSQTFASTGSTVILYIDRKPPKPPPSTPPPTSPPTSSPPTTPTSTASTPPP